MERDFLTIEPPPTFEYDGFAGDDPLLYVMHHAQIVPGGVLRLTPAEHDAWGSAWRDEMLDLSHGFSTTFECRVAECDPERGGGDGFAFNIHTYITTHLVPQNENGTTEYFTVQFITRREEERGDPSGNFIRVIFYGETWVVHNPGIDLKSGQVYTVTVEVAEGHILRVWLGNWRRRRGDLLFERQGTFFDHFKWAYVGFSAGNDLAYCNHDILRWSFTAGREIKPARRPPLVAWWPGNDTAEDVAGGHNPVNAQDIQYADGQVGRAFSCGTNSWLQIRPSVLLDVGSCQGFTLEAWVKPAGGAGGGGAVFEWDGLAIQLVAIPSSISGSVKGVSGETDEMHSFATSDGGVQPEVFSHVAMTYDRPTGVAKLYRNGVRVKEEVFGSFLIPTTGPLYVGQHPLNAPFNGLIDEPKIYGRCLTDEEIEASHRAGGAGAGAGVTVSGVVSDENGEGLRGVTLVLRNLDTSGASRSGRFASTDRRGAFVFRDVPKGYHYQVFPLESAEQYAPPLHDLPDLNEPQRVSFKRGSLLLKTQRPAGDAGK